MTTPEPEYWKPHQITLSNGGEKFIQIIREWNRMLNLDENKHLRPGQVLFHAILLVDPDLADEMTAKIGDPPIHDPFYDDDTEACIQGLSRYYIPI